MANLFDLSPQRIELPDGWLLYQPNWLSAAQAQQLFTHLKESLPWEQSNIRLYGKTHLTPRLEAFHADQGKDYGYSGKRLEVHPWTETLLTLRQRLEKEHDFRCNAVLANYYRDGRDSNGWHADNERE